MKGPTGDSNSNTKTLFYKDCNLGSVRNLSFYKDCSLGSVKNLLFYKDCSLRSVKNLLFYKDCSLGSVRVSSQNVCAESMLASIPTAWVLYWLVFFFPHHLLCGWNRFVARRSR